MGISRGRIYAQVFSLIQICSFGLLGVAYGAIWLKIQRTTRLMNGMSSTEQRYQSSARVMLIFVAVFILQWWSLTLFNVWVLVVTPPSAVLVLSVLLINLGGVYNCIAYTIIRRRLQRQKHDNPNSRPVTVGTPHQNEASSNWGSGVATEITLQGPDSACVNRSLSYDNIKASNEPISPSLSIPSHTEIHM